MSFYFLNLFATCGSIQKNSTVFTVEPSPKIHSKLQRLTAPEKNLMSRLELLNRVKN